MDAGETANNYFLNCGSKVTGSWQVVLVYLTYFSQLPLGWTQQNKELVDPRPHVRSGAPQEKGNTW